MGEERGPLSLDGGGMRLTVAAVRWGREEARSYAVEGRREPARTTAQGQPRPALPLLEPCATPDLGHRSGPDTPLWLCLLEEGTTSVAARPQPRTARYSQPLDRHRCPLSPQLDRLHAHSGALCRVLLAYRR
jgi:hypothetical protein